MKRIISISLALLLVLIFAGCSNNETQNAQTSENQTQTQSQSDVTVSESQTETENSITREQAIEIAEDALKDTDFSQFGINAKYDEFEFQACNLGNGDWRADQYKNNVWTVEYKYTNSLCDFVYFDIDEKTGEVLFSGYMGD